jgi:hypothetical protein
MSKTAFMSPPNSRPLKTLYAFVSEDGDGNHGIIAHGVGNVPNLPLVTMDERLLPAMRQIAREVKQATGKKVLLVTLKVESMEDL